MYKRRLTPVLHVERKALKYRMSCRTCVWLAANGQATNRETSDMLQKGAYNRCPYPLDMTYTFERPV